MDHGQTSDKPGLATAGDANPHVADVMRHAQQELRQLIEERAAVTKRIGTIKRTILGLAKLFGNGNLADPLDVFDHKRSSRQAGITSACRRVLMEAMRPMSARDVCDEILRTVPDFLARNKDPMSAVSTILSRLVKYGEATVLRGDHGQRVWLWAAERDSRSSYVPHESGSGPAI